MAWMPLFFHMQTLYTGNFGLQTNRINHNKSYLWWTTKAPDRNFSPNKYCIDNHLVRYSSRGVALALGGWGGGSREREVLTSRCDGHLVTLNCNCERFWRHWSNGHLSLFRFYWVKPVDLSNNKPSKFLFANSSHPLTFLTLLLIAIDMTVM